MNTIFSSKISKQKFSKKKILLLCTGIIFFVLLITTILIHNSPITITISAQNAEMIQDEHIPELTPAISIDGKNILLPPKKKALNKLKKELKSGGVVISCEADGHLEGDYPLNIALENKLEKKIKKEWKDKLKIILNPAVLTVKNKYGYFADDIFMDYDGNAVKNRFVVINGERCYIGEDSKKSTGWMTIEDKTYHFDEEGTLSLGWYDENGKTYYLDGNGVLQKGWITVEEQRYYADKDGAIVKGDFHENITQYHFDPVTGAYLSEGTYIDPSKPMLALTFDDGPGEDTMRLLETLEKYNAHATFFMCGNSLSRSDIDIQAILTKMDAIGCDTSNHTMSHPKLDTLTADGVRAEVNGVNDIINTYLGHGAKALRPPYGRGIHNQTVMENVNLPMIYWSVDTLDWKSKDKDATVKAILEQSSDGDIVLLHDIHSWSVDAAIEAIPKLIEKGFQLVTVTEMAAARNITLENGKTYFNFYP